MEQTTSGERCLKTSHSWRNCAGVLRTISPLLSLPIPVSEQPVSWPCFGSGTPPLTQAHNLDSLRVASRGGEDQGEARRLSPHDDDRMVFTAALSRAGYAREAPCFSH